MKRIEAFVKPFRLEDVRLALSEAGFGILRVSEAYEFGRETYRETKSGTAYEIETTPRLAIVAIVEEDQADRVVAIIQRAGVTGHPGDGTIIVSSVEQIVSVDGAE